MTIEIKEYSGYQDVDIIALYKAVDWLNYYENPQMLKNAYNNSLYILQAFHDEKLVGIIRVVGDGQSIIYIQDVIVLPDYQHKGIGTRLLSAVLEKYKAVNQKILLTDNTPKTIAFYKSLGFNSADNLNCVAFLFMQ